MSGKSKEGIATRTSESGFSLIEVMISMVLGLIVLGAAIAVFQSNQRTYRANQGLNRIQESARVAYEMVSRDIRSIGSSACSNEALVLGADATSLKFRAPVSGTASELTVTSSDDLSYRVNAATGNSVTLAEAAPVASDIFKANDVVMVCNAAMTGFVTVSSTSGQTVNFTSSLEFDPTDTTNAAAGSISIARMRSTRWYVANNSRGGKSLFVQRFGGTAEEVADGVESMALTYHQNSGGNPTTYVASPSDFNYVDAVRMVLQLKGTDVDNRPLTRTSSTTISVRSRTL